MDEKNQTGDLAPLREGLEQEINQLREVIRVVHEYTRETEDLKELLRILDGVSRATQRLAGLLKAQRDLERQGAEKSALNEQMLRVLRELAREKRGAQK